MFVPSYPKNNQIRVLRHPVDSFFDEFFGAQAERARTLRGGAGFPAINVHDAGNALHVEAEVPGLSREDVDVELHGRELTIKGRSSRVSDDREAYHRRERPSGEFARKLKLPYDVDAEKIKATLRNGLLDVELPKAASAMPRKVEIES